MCRLLSGTSSRCRPCLCLRTNLGPWPALLPCGPRCDTSLMPPPRSPVLRLPTTAAFGPRSPSMVLMWTEVRGQWRSLNCELRGPVAFPWAPCKGLGAEGGRRDSSEGTGDSAGPGPRRSWSLWFPLALPFFPDGNRKINFLQPNRIITNTN